VLLVRPWRDARGGGGCCSGDLRGGVCRDHPVGHDAAVAGGAGPADPAEVVAAAYRLLRAELPGIDVQIVSAGNVGYLIPAAFREARRHCTTTQALRHAVRSTTAGAVVVDGVVVGDVETLGPAGVLDAVRQAGSGTSSTAATV
jgi:hypothetical protein